MIDELVHLFNQGKLTEAIEAGNAAVAKNPRDLPVRLVLIQLVCFTGAWDRVEKIAKQLAVLDPNHDHIELTNFIDQLSIAEASRKAVWTEGMIPDFIQPPDEVTKKLLWAMSCQRSGDVAQFQDALGFVLENAPQLTLTLNGNQYEGFRDLDDQTCTVFEAHTIQGEYLWIPHSSVKSMDVSKPTRLVDHLWSKARIKLTDDTDIVVYLPGIYFHSFGPQVDDSLRLGRETLWQDNAGVDVGLGRRIFGAGDEEFTLFDFENVSLEATP
jgi:type VI secretion system protein ImpE